MARPDVWIGTSGYVYKHWQDGVFYPPGLPQKEELEFFARSFRTVELNNPFYRLPPRETFINWRRRTPADFLFAVKASRYITHIKKLKDPEEPLKLFLDHALGLGDKLGPILFQFPGSWKVDVERLDNFLRHLPQRLDCAFEFRHKTWFSEPVYDRLKESRAALCLPVGPEGLRADEAITSDFTYLRMHASSGESGDFTGKELDEWAAKIQTFRQAGITVYIYFNNDQRGFAIRNALKLRDLLGLPR